MRVVKGVSPTETRQKRYSPSQGINGCIRELLGWRRGLICILAPTGSISPESCLLQAEYHFLTGVHPVIAAWRQTVRIVSGPSGHTSMLGLTLLVYRFYFTIFKILLFFLVHYIKHLCHRKNLSWSRLLSVNVSFCIEWPLYASDQIIDQKWSRIVPHERSSEADLHVTATIRARYSIP